MLEKGEHAENDEGSEKTACTSHNDSEPKDKGDKVDRKRAKKVNCPKGPESQPPADKASTTQTVGASSPWFKYHLHPIIQNGLVQLNFHTPTRIQTRVLDTLIKTVSEDTQQGVVELRDIMGASPTVS